MRSRRDGRPGFTALSTRRNLMKVKVDQDLCTGDGICAELCPQVFQLNDDGIAEIIVSKVPADAEDACREAAESCPESCIIIEE
jgi:ferredoxin